MQKECCKESGLWVPMKYKCVKREGHGQEDHCKGQSGTNLRVRGVG